MRRWGIVLSCLVFPGLALSVAYACGLDYTFRGYLDRRFWQPFSKYEESLKKVWPRSKGTGEDTKTVGKSVAPYAGMSSDGASDAMQKARDAYRSGAYSQAREAVAAALQTGLSELEKEEALLVDAKLDMRLGESGDQTLLQQAREKLQAFLPSARMPAWRSEARGWLARAHYLLGEYSAAANIYLDELTMADSIFSRESLVQSLRMLFPYNGSSSRLVDHLEEYFDTPEHALFVVNIVTNPIYHDAKERAAMATVAEKSIEVLKNHRALFESSATSEALALAMMRAALYMGDTHSALEYSRLVAEKSDTASSPEYCWMTAACHFLQHQYAAAEAPLLKMADSQRASGRDRSAAAQGLIGVYHKLGRAVDQLHAAFLYHWSNAELFDESISFGSIQGDVAYNGFMYWPMGGWLLDLPYLLDVQLSDAELRAYLKRYAKSAKQIVLNLGKRQRSAYEMVEYALAVRLARQEKFDTAAAIYERLHAWPRAKRMRELGRLHADSKNTALPPPQSLEAKYTYAAFLEEHSTQVFFNDMLWDGFQTTALLGRREYERPDGYLPVPADAQGLTREERESFLARERRLKDEQEERWRAYQILKGIIDEAGHSELGRRAVQKARKCLSLINTDRFGRDNEIESAKILLTRWLRDDRQQGLEP
jgi:hypothetical protein